MDVQSWSGVRRDQPLFESVLAFENYPVNASQWQQSAELEIASLRGIEETNYPLAVTVVPGDELVLKVAYSINRFDAPTITRLFGHFRILWKESSRIRIGRCQTCCGCPTRSGLNSRACTDVSKSRCQTWKSQRSPQ